jgi:hypothetical protein
LWHQIYFFAGANYDGGKLFFPSTFLSLSFHSSSFSFPHTTRLLTLTSVLHLLSLLIMLSKTTFAYSTILATLITLPSFIIAQCATPSPAERYYYSLASANSKLYMFGGSLVSYTLCQKS